MFYFLEACNEFWHSFWHRSGKDDPQASLNGIGRVTDKVSKLDIDADVDLKDGPTAEHQSVSVIPECKCGMPLCICEAAPSTDALPLQV